YAGHVHRALGLIQGVRHAAGSSLDRGRLLEAVRIVESDHAPVSPEPVAEARVSAHVAAWPERGILIEADVGEIRVLVDVERILHPRRSAPASLSRLWA